MTFLLILFWLSVAAIITAYGLFPLVIYLRGRLFARPYTSAPIRPTVSLVMAMHNEERDLPARLENLDQLEYPRDRLEVLIDEIHDAGQSRLPADRRYENRRNSMAYGIPIEDGALADIRRLAEG